MSDAPTPLAERFPTETSSPNSALAPRDLPQSPTVEVQTTLHTRWTELAEQVRKMATEAAVTVVRDELASALFQQSAERRAIYGR